MSCFSSGAKTEYECLNKHGLIKADSTIVVITTQSCPSVALYIICVRTKNHIRLTLIFNMK